MKILLVAATMMETAWLREQTEWETIGERQWKSRVGALEIDLLVTGIGMVNTAFALGAYFAHRQPDLAINFGIAGAYSSAIKIGTVVEVISEIYGELGAESPEGFLDLAAMGFAHYEGPEGPVYNQMHQSSPSLDTLPAMVGLTVNRVHGTAQSIQSTREKWNPDVESMEGAAFFQACLQKEIPFREFRSVSNLVEPRNRANWNIPLALKNVQSWVWNWLQTLQ